MRNGPTFTYSIVSMHVCNRYTQSMSLSENIFGVKPLDACRRSRDGGIVSSNSGSLTTSSIDNASKQTSKTLKNKHTGTMKKKVVDRNNTSTTATNITYVTTPSGVKSASNRADGQAGPSSAAITKKIVIRKNVATSLVPTVAASTAGSSDSFDALDMSALLRQTILVRIMLAKRTKEESLIIGKKLEILCIYASILEI